MRHRVIGFAARHTTTVLLGLFLVTLLLAGSVGEVAAHNPAGHPVPGCENGADVVAHENPNCHGG